MNSLTHYVFNTQRFSGNLLKGKKKKKITVKVTSAIRLSNYRRNVKKKNVLLYLEEWLNYNKGPLSHKTVPLSESLSIK